MEKRFETREMPPIYGRAMIGTIDTDKRTFDVTFATNSEVPMWNWDRGEHLEVLDMKPESVRLTRINSGAPLLNNHRSWGGVEGVLGKVIPGSAKVTGDRATATIQMSNREDSVVTGAWRDIQDGILSTLSVGYQVHRAVLEDTEKKLYRATDWEPFEISLAPIPADIGATIREKAEKYSMEIEVEETENEYQRDADYISLLQARYKNY